jgi:Tol biopolymer transport system component
LAFAATGDGGQMQLYVRRLSQLQATVLAAGENVRDPFFSPDGQWIAFTSYFDRYEVHGCEIYIMRVDGTDLRRLTENDYCDYQPRWGP